MDRDDARDVIALKRSTRLETGIQSSNNSGIIAQLLHGKQIACKVPNPAWEMTECMMLATD